MEWMEPMEPVLTDSVVRTAGYIHHIKWDGIRGLTYVQNGQVRIFNKSGRERTGFYPEAEKIGELINVKEAVLDGELVVFDKSRPSFQSVLKRDRLNNIRNLSLFIEKYPVRYILFDMLWYNGMDIRYLPLNKRMDMLRSCFKPNEFITVTDDFTDGAKLFDLMKHENLEGIVSKSPTGFYIGGKRHNYWYKTKVQKKILAIVFGLNLKEGFPSSLILGVYHDGIAVYIGSAAIGLKNSDLRLLSTYTERLRQNNCPFVEYDISDNVIWLKPSLTCWIGFAERTSEGLLRQPRILGFTDLSVDEAVGDEIIT